MIDFSTYKKMHPAKVSQKPEEREFDDDIMIQENLPAEDVMNLFPSTVAGYNLRLKKWGRSSHAPIFVNRKLISPSGR